MLSIASARPNITDDNGLTPIVAIAPNNSAHNAGAARNSQADTPAARATISSDERVRRQKHSMPPSSTANGSTCIAT